MRACERFAPGRLVRISTVRCRANQKQFARAAGTAMNKALDGINLVEFDSNLGASYAAMLLAEQGARAVRWNRRAARAPAARRISMRSIAASARSSSTFKPSELGSSGCSDGPASRYSDGPGRGCASSSLITRMLRRINPYLVVLHLPPLGNRGATRQFRRQRRTGLRARRHLRQPVGAQRKSGGLAFPRRQLFRGRARRDRDGRGALRPRLGQQRTVAGTVGRGLYWPARFRFRPAASCATKR